MSPSVPEMEGIYATGGILFFFENVPLVEFIYLVFTRTPGGVIVGDSGLCCCVPCLSGAIISLCLLIFNKLCVSENSQGRREVCCAFQKIYWFIVMFVVFQKCGTFIKAFVVTII